MAWEFSLITKDKTSREKSICNIIYLIKTNMITRFFPKVLVKFLRSNIKYAVPSAVSCALTGALKVALLSAMTVKYCV